MNDWYIPTKNDIRAMNERNRRYNESIGRSEERYHEFWLPPPTNNWREIKKARRGPVSPWRVWITGFVWGAVTLGIMSYLTWLAWRAF